MAKKTPTNTAPEAVDFEASMAELDTIVSALERGDLTLEQSLAQFERGVSLTRLCRDALVQAEQKVAILLKDQDPPRLAPFDAPANDASES